MRKRTYLKLAILMMGLPIALSACASLNTATYEKEKGYVLTGTSIPVPPFRDYVRSSQGWVLGLQPYAEYHTQDPWADQKPSRVMRYQPWSGLQPYSPGFGNETCQGC